ncbi:MAG TPA: hypothetical protein VNX47_02485 [Nevskia sp.]|jgi:hypothetical protein|nr:hypothetical protein [Nevskia sp.]
MAKSPQAEARRTKLNRATPAMADAKVGDVLDDLINAANGVPLRVSGGTPLGPTLLAAYNQLQADVAALRTKYNQAQADIAALYVAVMAASTAPAAKTSIQMPALTSAQAAAPADQSSGAILTLGER